MFNLFFFLVFLGLIGEGGGTLSSQLSHRDRFFDCSTQQPKKKILMFSNVFTDLGCSSLTSLCSPYFPPFGRVWLWMNIRSKYSIN